MWCKVNYFVIALGFIIIIIKQLVNRSPHLHPGCCLQAAVPPRCVHQVALLPLQTMDVQTLLEASFPDMHCE